MLLILYHNDINISQGQSQIIDFLLYDDIWVEGSHNKVSLKITAPTISMMVDLKNQLRRL